MYCGYARPDRGCGGYLQSLTATYIPFFPARHLSLDNVGRAETHIKRLYRRLASADCSPAAAIQRAATDVNLGRDIANVSDGFERNAALRRNQK